MTAPALVLASASASRAAVLAGAGVEFASDRAGIDESEIKRSMKAEGADIETVAAALAELKAMRVSSRHAGALVIGADQILECNGVWFDKPADEAQARAHLASLRGRRHSLVSAAAVARDGGVIWRDVARAELTMRAFSDRFLDHYLGRIGAGALETVGCYRVEGIGIQLFSRIDGEHSTILGLPLLPLLEFLREHGVVER